MEDLNKPDTSGVLNVPKDNLTLDLIKQHLTFDEQLWLQNLVRAYGEKEVLSMWPSYEVQINYVRNF